MEIILVRSNRTFMELKFDEFERIHVPPAF